MFATIQHSVPSNFDMGTVRVIDAMVTTYGQATVESWDTYEGRLFYALDENGNLLAPATLRKMSALLEAKQHVRMVDYLREKQH